MVDPRLLERVFVELSEEISRRENLVSESAKQSLIQESTLWEALPRMRWALWRRQGTSQSAVRLHLSLHVLEDKPQRAKITPGVGCEPQAWRETWQPGDAYVGDRYYGGITGCWPSFTKLGVPMCCPCAKQRLSRSSKSLR